MREWPFITATQEQHMGISRHATAHWEGDLKSGKGQLSTPQSGLLDKTRYGFNSRFGDEKGTNPEELIAAAHGCFTMALSAKLGEAGSPRPRWTPRPRSICPWRAARSCRRSG